MGFGSAVPWTPIECAPAIPVATSDRRSEPTIEPVRTETKRTATTRGWVNAAAVGLLVLYALLAITASWRKGLSFDEGVQLAVGYNIWLNDDLRIEGANGDFVKRWATLPFLFSKPAFVSSDDPARTGYQPYELGRKFLFECGNQPEALLRQSRPMITLLGVMTGALVFLWSRRLFGPVGGLISLSIFVFSPSMLAFGGVVSTDMSITLALFAAVAGVARVLWRVTLARLCVSLGCVGVLVLAKPTALVIFPITALLIALRLCRRVPLQLEFGPVSASVRRRRVQVVVITGLLLLHVAMGWLAIWAHYQFRFEAGSIDPGVPAMTVVRDDVPAVLAGVLRWCNETRLLPHAFLNGIDALLASDDGLGSFMHGEWKIGGWAGFFPYAMWVKTPPALFILLGLGVIGSLVAVRLRLKNLWLHPWVAERGWTLAPLLALIGCYTAVAMTEDLNIGHRHILPIYPALYVLAGAAVLVGRRWRRWGTIGIVGSIFFLAADSFRVRPHYLAYFAPHAGGPENGYKHLVDSSLEWGMDLPELKRWRDRQDPKREQPLFLAYFGTDSVQFHGIDAKRLPGFVERRSFEVFPLSPGYYAISASLFQSVYSAAFGPWSREYERLYRQTLQSTLLWIDSANNPVRRRELLQIADETAWLSQIDLFDNLRFARLCAWLRHRAPPHDHVAYSILIWKLTAADLEAALFGAPEELVDEPPKLRRFRQFAANNG
jgi:hypothetical protein